MANTVEVCQKGIWIMGERGGAEKVNKRIRMITINKIKKLSLRIFEYQDSDYPNNRGASACYRAIEHYLKKDGIVYVNLKAEVLSCVDWTRDDCASLLESKGWEIVKTKGEI